MEHLNPTASCNHRLSAGQFDRFSPKFPFRSCKNNTPPKFSIPHSKKSSPCLPFPVDLPHFPHSRFQISAHFRRPSSKRQNYLRKKLTQHKQVSLGSDFGNPVHIFIDNDASDKNLDSNEEKRRNLESTNYGFFNNDVGTSASLKETELESQSKLLAGTSLFNKLENWVEQCKKDIEFWGVGTGAIFSVFQDSDGTVKRVVVNEDEILRRLGFEPLLYKDRNVDDLSEVNERISYAKILASKMENGNDLLARNSSVVKFVTLEGKSGLVNMIQGVNLKPVLHSKISRIGMIVVCGVFVILAAKRFFTFEEGKQEYMSLEKEMMRRKLKARMEKERKMKGVVEAIRDPTSPTISVERPQLDKQELTKVIANARELSSTTAFSACGVSPVVIPSAEEMTQRHGFVGDRDEMDHADGYEGQRRNRSRTTDHTLSIDDPKNENGFVLDATSTEKGWTQASEPVKIPDETERPTRDVGGGKLDLHSIVAVQISEHPESSKNHSAMPCGSRAKKQFKVIQSVKEAREYLSKKHDSIESSVENEERNTEQFQPTLTVLDEKAKDLVKSRQIDASEKVSGSDNMSVSDSLFRGK